MSFLAILRAFEEKVCDSFGYSWTSRAAGEIYFTYAMEVTIERSVMGSELN